MQFLDWMSASERERLQAAARPMLLARGGYLMRRGDPGGDLYLVQQGVLEIVDTRSRPEVILDQVGPGGVVGEMSFLDATPRTADARAAVEVSCLWWARSVLQRVLEEDPSLAAAFHRALAALMVERLRSFTTAAVSGSFGRRTSPTALTGPLLARGAFDLAERARARWVEVDARLRLDAQDPLAAADAAATANSVLEDAMSWLASVEDADRRGEAGAALSRELHAFLVRARLVGLTWESAGRGGARSAALTHIYGDLADGDGALGVALDAALLRCPTAVALRWRTAVAAMAAAVCAGWRHGEPPARVLVVNGAVSGLADRVLEVEGLALTALEEDRGPLAEIGGHSDQLRRVQEELLQICTGRSRQHHGGVRAIAIDGLTEYLPDRLLASLLGWCLEQVSPGGGIVLTALAPAPDADLFDHVLGWKTVRRSPSSLAGLMAAVGLRGMRVHSEGAGIVVSGFRRTETDNG